LPAGYTDIGGYNLAFVNDAAYDVAKQLNVYWAGVRYTVIPNLDLTAAYYGYRQNAYGTGKAAGCTTDVYSACSGSFEAFSSTQTTASTSTSTCTAAPCTAACTTAWPAATPSTHQHQPHDRLPLQVLRH